MSVGIDLERFSRFRDAEFRSLEILSPADINLTFAIQDKAREFDWITIELEFSGVSDARLLKEHQLSFIDLSDGINILKDENRFAFGIGDCYNLSAIKNSSCYIISSGFKYKEGLF